MISLSYKISALKYRHLCQKVYCDKNWSIDLTDSSKSEKVWALKCTQSKKNKK